MDVSRHKNLLSVSVFYSLSIYELHSWNSYVALFFMKAVSAETVKFVRKSAKLILYLHVRLGADVPVYNMYTVYTYMCWKHGAKEIKKEQWNLRRQMYQC
jgi:hypothetical protein